MTRPEKDYTKQKKYPIMKMNEAFYFPGKPAIACLGSLALLSACQHQETKNEKPNIILILVDDMGYSDPGCYGSEIATPNLDRLAAEGIQMTRFYNAARCCPTRASLLTGLYQHQAGVGQMVHDLGTPAYQGYLNEHCMTIAEVLRSNDYQTFMSGKWHVGEEKGHWPLDRGFERYFGLINGASNFYRLQDYRNPDDNKTFLLDSVPYELPEITEEMWRNNEGFYMTDAFTDYALEFVQEGLDAEKPFFLYLAYTAPHWPLHAFPEDYEKYLSRYGIGWDSLREERFARQLKSGIFEDPGILSPRDDHVIPWTGANDSVKEEFILDMALYAGMIDRMDRNIGRLLTLLRDENEIDNTLIIFLSDNGGCHTHPVFEHLQGTPGGPNSFPCYHYQGANVSNTPFRMYKQFIHEGGIATPCIIHYPQRIKEGRLEDYPGHIIDIMPTILELTGADYPEQQKGQELIPLQGTSLMPLFENREPERNNPIFWEHVGNRGVRRDNWKLVARKPGLKWELYDIIQDPTELKDLSAEFPGKTTELIALYHDWAGKNGVLPWPTE